jgi:site-specific recombinase XerD
VRYLTVDEVAKDLGITKRSVQRYCKLGLMPAEQIWVKNNSAYQIPSHQYYRWKVNQKANDKDNFRVSTPKSADDLSGDIEDLIIDWLDWCKTGKLCGKPLSPRMIEIYNYYFRLYLKGLSKRELKQPITLELARKVIGSFPPASYSTKLNIYSSLMSFGKYLIENGRLEADFRTKLKTIRPRRFLPAKRTSLNEGQYRELVQSVESATLTGGFSTYDKVLTKALIVFISNTGLRNAECCKLKLEDVDLDARKIYIKLGKGNKNREVGVNDEAYAAVNEYLEVRDKFDSEFLFLTKLGNRFSTDILSGKIRKVTRRFGFKDISPHSLRRTFASIKSARGKPLNHLRIALGHADLSTTQSYIMTTQNEVVEAMRNW